MDNTPTRQFKYATDSQLFGVLVYILQQTKSLFYSQLICAFSTDEAGVAVML
jgi:hypothetical protein